MGGLDKGRTSWGCPLDPLVSPEGVLQEDPESRGQYGTRTDIAVAVVSGEQWGVWAGGHPDHQSQPPQ